MYKGLNLRFEYVIRFPDGKYYTGRAGIDYHGEKNESFKYTQAGAYAKIERMSKVSSFWANASVERV